MNHKTTFHRILNLKKLAQSSSVFLLGPRSTGKTSLILQSLKPELHLDLLDLNTLMRLQSKPQSLIEELSTLKPNSLVVIDEIQKIPELLNPVHQAIEKWNHRFVLTGSSARKLKKNGVNLLGGRARPNELFPLTFSEIPDFDLLKYLNTGGIPRHYLSDDSEEDLIAYTQLYLKEEIVQEALTQNLPMFSRFLETIALHSGDELSYEGISNDSGVNSKTVKNYVQILEDTLIGFKVPAYTSTRKRKAISRSKFYLFDIGVTNSIAQRKITALQGEDFGRSFENWIACELRAYLSYRKIRKPLQFWRSKSNFEVDFIIGDELAIEVKATREIATKHLRGLKALKEEGKVKKYILISQTENRRKIDGIDVYPWRSFMEALWSDELLK